MIVSVNFTTGVTETQKMYPCGCGWPEPNTAGVCIKCGGLLSIVGETQLGPLTNEREAAKQGKE